MKTTNKQTTTNKHNSLPYLLATLGIIIASGALGAWQDAPPAQRRQIARSYQATARSYQATARSYQATARGAQSIGHQGRQVGQQCTRLLGMLRR